MGARDKRYGRIVLNEPAMEEVLATARRHMSLGRAGGLALFVFLWETVPRVTTLGHALDDRLYPGWRDQKVEAPVFIFANARSGTTLLHRLMSFDDERWSGMRLYQSFLNGVALQRAFQSLGRIDTQLPRHPLRRGVDWINSTFFSGWDGIHKLGIDEFEEDETSFAICMNSITINLLLPFTDELPSLRFLDRADPEFRERFMDFYEATVKRHLYATDPDKRFLDKNVFLTPRVRTLLSRFPDARFIHLTRHPYEAVPSFLSMWYDKWRTHSPDIAKDGPEMRALFDLSVDYSLYALELKRELPPSTLREVRYRDLVRSPQDTVEAIYDWLGLTPGAAFREKLREVSQDQRIYDSPHDYCLEEFGLSREEIYERLRPVFDAGHFEP